MIDAQRERYISAYSEESIDAAIVEAEAGVEKCRLDGSGVIVLPGKEMLDEFRKKHISKLPGDLFREQIMSRMLETQVMPSQISELCEFINSK